MIGQLRDLGWDWSRIAAHYKVSERQVRRWGADEQDGVQLPGRLPAPPVELYYGTAFVVSDTQFPFHDPALWEVVCDIYGDLQPDKLIWDGDILDFPQLSTKFKHNAYQLRTAQTDVEDFHDQLRSPLIASHSPADEAWSDGNHEDRYGRYAYEVATALEDSLKSARDFLQLPETVRYHPYGRAIGEWIIPNKLLVSHGWRASAHSAYTAKANLEDLGGGVSVITGHTHRTGQYNRTTALGVVRAYEIGHMADERTVPKAVPGKQNWQQVAGTVVRYARDGSDFDVSILNVLNDDRVIANDRVYQIER